MIPPNDAHITLMNYDDPLEWAQSVTRELENILLQEITQRGRASCSSLVAPHRHSSTKPSPHGP